MRPTAPVKQPSIGAIFSSRVFLCVLLGVATLALYWQALTCDFISFDDPDYVTNNPMVQQGVSMHGVVWALRSVHANNWHPVTWISHMLDASMFGASARGPHGVNIFLHAANAMLVFLLLARMTGKHWRSAFVAALFAAHPLHVESVAWISERKDLLCAFFGLLALLAYVNYAAARPGRKTAYLLAVVWLALSLMSKAMLVTFPLVLVLLDYWPLERLGVTVERGAGVTTSTLLIEKAPFAILSMAAAVVTLIAQAGSGAAASVSAVGIAPRIENAIVSYVHYLGKCLWPENLAVFYPYAGHHVWEVVLCAGYIAGITVAVICARRARPYLLVGWLWYVITLIPVIGFVQVGKQSMADRYTYLPLLGIFIACVWGMDEIRNRFPSSRAVVLVAASVAIIACGVMTRIQLGYWRNSETLFRHALVATKDNEVANEDLGNYLADQGRNDEAIPYFREALRIEPGNGSLHNDLAVTLLTRGDAAGATQEFQQALRINPESTNALMNLGVALDVQHQTKEAIESLEKAVSLAPGYAEARNNLGHVLAETGQLQDAVTQYNEAIRLRPGFAQAHYNLGSALAQLGERDAAIAQLSEALKLKPDYEAARRRLQALTGGGNP